MRGRKDDLNIKGAFLHMASDALVSLGVVVAGALILLTGWLWLDPLTSLAIVVVITAGTWGLLRDSVNLAMDAVPPGLDHASVQSRLRDLPGVIEVHDLHIWGLSTSDAALTAHLVVGEMGQGVGLVERACSEVRRHFGIGHCTFQVETTETAQFCSLRPEHVI
jgi:cobalt-zinc-cadmium efflux system protein